MHRTTITVFSLLCVRDREGGFCREFTMTIVGLQNHSNMLTWLNAVVMARLGPSGGEVDASSIQTWKQHASQNVKEIIHWIRTHGQPRAKADRP